MLADKGFRPHPIIAIQRIQQLKLPEHRPGVKIQILHGREYAMAHELGRPAGPVVVAHLEADAVVYFLKVREAARILTPDIGAGPQFFEAERRGLVSGLRGASRCPNGLKLDKETTLMEVRWTRVASMA